MRTFSELVNELFITHLGFLGLRDFPQRKREKYLIIH
jgi:hypothetical protein